MPELLSLKDRLKLFEKEIEQQAAGPPAEAKKDRKFSFLSEVRISTSVAKQSQFFSGADSVAKFKDLVFVTKKHQVIKLTVSRYLFRKI